MLMKERNFKLKAEEIKKLIEPMGSCIATDTITVDGLQVKYMDRNEPIDDMDSGWRFYSGKESQEYLDDAENSCMYNVNTIVNYDPAIMPYLDYPFGTELERIDGTNLFQIVSG